MSGCNQVIQGDCGASIRLHVPRGLTTTPGSVVAGIVGHPCAKVLPGVAYLARLVWAPVLPEPPVGVSVCASLSLRLDSCVLMNIALGIATAPSVALCCTVAAFAGILWSYLRLSLGKP